MLVCEDHCAFNDLGVYLCVQLGLLFAPEAPPPPPPSNWDSLKLCLDLTPKRHRMWHYINMREKERERGPMKWAIVRKKFERMGGNGVDFKGQKRGRLSTFCLYNGAEFRLLLIVILYSFFSNFFSFNWDYVKFHYN